MQKLWREFSGWFHIGALLVTIGTVYGMMTGSVNAQAERLTRLEVRHETLEKCVFDIKSDTAALRQSVDDIKDALHVRRRDGL